MADEDKVIQAIAARLGGSAREMRRQFQLDPFTFVIPFVPLAASDTETDDFITQADSGFAIARTAFTVSSTAEVFVSNISDTPKFAPFVITLSDSGSGRNLSNAPVSIDTYFGSGQRPFIWATPKVLDPNSTFTARIQNLVATAFHIRLSFHGFKIFGNVGAFRQAHR